MWISLFLEEEEAQANHPVLVLERVMVSRVFFVQNPVVQNENPRCLMP